ncbi:MAG TPA: NAD(P)H-binding protein [Streptosporangiaceae bacterium]|jgi:uncharacterized protein YbjT (DUF2867 family)
MILVTGATGVVGRPLVQQLAEAGAEVRAVSRDPYNAGLPEGVEVVAGDPGDAATMTAALAGVTAMFLNPRTVGTAAEKLLALAREQGVRRVVAMSAINVEWALDRQPSRLNGDFNKEVEEAVTASGMEWACLRSGVYAVNTIGMWAGQLRAGDVVRGAYPDGAWASLHEADIAAVGAHGLLTDDLIGRKPVLTGPVALTQAEMVAAIAAATGRPLRFQEVPPEAAQEGMMRAGIPERAAAGFLRMQAEAYGQPDLVSGEVEAILGRPGRTYGEWAADHAADFAA